MSIAVLVANADDELARAVHEQLHRTGVRSECYTPEQLGDVALTIDAFENDGVRPLPLAHGEPLGAVLWLVRPDGSLSDGWPLQDRAFVDAEIRSAWLAVLDHPDVLAINAFDADMWFEGASWPACRRALRVAHAEHAAIGYGNGGTGPWLPFQAREVRPRPAPAAVSTLSVPGVGENTDSVHLALFGEVIPMHSSSIVDAAGAANRLVAADAATSSHSSRFEIANHNKGLSSTEEVAHALQGCGIQLALLFANARGVVQWVDPLPTVPSFLNTHVAHTIAERIHAHLSGR